MMIYPLTIGGACILTSILGTYFVKLGRSKNIMTALYKGFVVTAITSLIILYPITDHVLGLNNTYNIAEIPANPNQPSNYPFHCCDYGSQYACDDPEAIRDEGSQNTGFNPTQIQQRMQESIEAWAEHI